MEGRRTMITSFNCAGFKGSHEYISNVVFKKCDILFLQEHWLYNFEFKCQYHATSAMDESVIRRVGRPSGGCAIIWHKDLALSVTPIETKSPRLCAVVIKSDHYNMLMCNVYMPCDENTDVNYDIYGDILFEILMLNELYSGYEFIIGGDFNVDFRRNNSRNMNLLKQFINDELLTCVTLVCPQNEYTFQCKNKDRPTRSFIDHFIVSKNLINCNIYLSHDGDNLYGHEPISIETPCISNIIPCNNVARHVIEWEKASSEHIDGYKSSLDNSFRHLTISQNVRNCNDFNCRKHDDYILNKLEEAIDIFKFCANVTLPN